MTSGAVVREYDRLARRYEARWHHYVESSTKRTLHHLTLLPGRRLLDIGCGTGVFLGAALHLEPLIHAAGVDLSLEMLAVAQQRLPASTTLLRADVQRLPFEEERFDVVVSASSFHYWDDPRLGLREIGRVLRSGGQLVVTDWCDDYWGCRLCDRFLRVTNRAHRRIYNGRECDALLTGSGYQVARIDQYKIDWFWGLMTIKAERSAT